MLCAKKGKCTCTLYVQKNPVCIQILGAYTGIGDAETQSAGMLRKPGGLPQVCPRPKKIEGLATRDTLHESRPNLRRRDVDSRIVPTPSDVSDKGASTKRYARRKQKMTIIHIHISEILIVIPGVSFATGSGLPKRVSTAYTTCKLLVLVRD